MLTRRPAPEPELAAQVTAVYVDQVVVEHRVVPTCTEGVMSDIPMLTPMTVIEIAEVWAMLPGLMYVITGVSYVNRSSVVPSKPLNVTTARCRVPTPT
jgi:hypothetical protein